MACSCDDSESDKSSSLLEENEDEEAAEEEEAKARVFDGLVPGPALFRFVPAALLVLVLA